MNDDASMSDPPIPPEETPAPKAHIPLKQKQLLYTIPVLLLLVVGMGVAIMSLQKNQDIRGRAASTGPTLALAPATETGAVGDTFSLGATLNTNSDSVSAAELQLSYDPTAVQILSFSAGTGLPTILAPETHADGTIAVTLGSPMATPFTGAGIIGTWQVKILADKASSISFTSATQVASVGKTTNSLVSATGTTITVAGATPSSTTSTPTPTPTTAQSPKATPTPTPTVARQPTATPTPASVFHALSPTATPTPTPVVTTPMTGFGQIGSTQTVPFVPATSTTPSVPQNQPKPSFIEQVFISLGSFFVKLLGR